MSICHCFRLCSHIQHKQNKNKDPSRQQQKAPCLLFLCHSGHTPGCSPVPSPGSLCLRDLAQVPHPGMYRLSWECLGTHGDISGCHEDWGEGYRHFVGRGAGCTTGPAMLSCPKRHRGPKHKNEGSLVLWLPTGTNGSAVPWFLRVTQGLPA